MYQWVLYVIVAAAFLVIAVERFGDFFESERMRGSAGELVLKLQLYRQAKCGDPPGTRYASAAVVSDATVFPNAADRVDPAAEHFAWAYEVGNGSMGFLVVTGSEETRRRVQNLSGGWMRGTELLVPLRNNLAVMIPDFHVNVMGEGGSACI